VTRHAHSTGHHVERRFGWDTHGLPVEHEIDIKLGITGKEDVMAMGIDKYNEECRAIVRRPLSLIHLRKRRELTRTFGFLRFVACFFCFGMRGWYGNLGHAIRWGVEGHRREDGTMDRL
jgi:hypothetical protein